MAPVILKGNSATIHSVRVHYLDNSPGNTCAWLCRPNLKAGGEKVMSSMCTKSAVNGVRTRTDTTINPDTVGSPDHNRPESAPTPPIPARPSVGAGLSTG